MSESTQRTKQKPSQNRMAAGEVGGHACRAVERLEEMLPLLSPIERTVIDGRLLHEPPMSLAEVGAQFGRTRERIRQIQVQLERRVASAIGTEVQRAASVIRRGLARVMEKHAFEKQIDARLGDGAGRPERLFRKLVINEMGYSCRNGQYLNEQAQAVIAKIRHRMPGLADDVGLVDKSRLLADLPGRGWHRYWPLLRRHTKLHELYGSLSLRGGRSARAKAALVSIGRASTREEVAAVCQMGAVLTAKTLARIPSVVRVRKHLWALKEWAEEEYTSIGAAIIRRIKAGGGSTTTERLLRELPEQCGVKAESVRAYIHTPQFVVEGGRIRLATLSDIDNRLRRLDDAVDGHDKDGAPYIVFAAQPGILAGGGVRGVAPEFVRALGCEPNGRFSAEIENLPMCRPLSLRWKLTSITGGHLGHVADALKARGIRSGQPVRVTLKGRGVVEVSEHRC